MWIESYILNHLNTVEYYNQRLLGVTRFMLVVDTTGTIDELVFGIHKLEIEFKLKYDSLAEKSITFDFCHSVSVMNEFYSTFDIVSCVIYADLYLLTLRNLDFITDYNFETCEIHIDSVDKIKCYHKTNLVYNNLIDLFIEDDVDVSGYYFEEGVYHTDKLSEFDFLETVAIDTSKLMLSYEPQDCADMSTKLKRAYESNLRVRIIVDGELGMDYIWETLHTCKKQGYKLLDYDGSISEQKMINGREFEVISKDYIRLLELFDDVICGVEHDR